ncbi:unnamed protein product [Closterium sp. Naga37s-1]|nr:unnamed protein product [Closterium sp. Naga37s-1]
MATPVVGAAAQVGASGGATAARAADAERAQLVQQLNLAGVRARVAELQGSIARVMGAFHEQHVHLKCSPTLVPATDHCTHPCARLLPALGLPSFPHPPLLTSPLSPHLTPLSSPHPSLLTSPLSPHLTPLSSPHPPLLTSPPSPHLTPLSSPHPPLLTSPLSSPHSLLPTFPAEAVAALSVVSAGLYSLVDDVMPMLRSFAVCPATVTAHNAAVLPIMLSSKLLPEMEVEGRAREEALRGPLAALPVAQQLELLQLQAKMVDVACERAEKVILDARKAHGIGARQAAASVAALYGAGSTDKAALARVADQEKLLRNALATGEGFRVPPQPAAAGPAPPAHRGHPGQAAPAAPALPPHRSPAAPALPTPDRHTLSSWRADAAPTSSARR